MPGRPPKSHLQLVDEKKSHLTKAQLDARKKGEEALLTGTPFREWPEVRANKVAHKEFGRLRKLFKKISHDDGLHESVLNRFCLLHAECKQLEEIGAKLFEDIEELKELRAEGCIDILEYLDRKDKLYNQIMTCDKKVMEKRKMMLSIEKENIMTIAAALRAVPKKPQEQAKSNMAKFLEDRQAKGNGS